MSQSNPARAQEATERSPLLPGNRDEQSDVNGSIKHAVPATEIGRGSAPSGQGAGEEAVQGEEEIRNYDGMPEVQKKLKYIIPALAVGVSSDQLCLTNNPLRLTQHAV